MENARPVDCRFIHACQEYPPDLTKIKALLEQGADVNRVTEDESVIGEILLSYPQVRDLQCEHAAECCSESCAGCRWSKVDGDGRYLPLLIRFLIENGFDVTKHDGRVGAFALSMLCFADRDRYAVDACKLLLEAGADPLVVPSAGDQETALTSVGFEGFFNSSENPKKSVVDETMYRMMKAKSEGREFAQIEHCDVCIGRRIDRILLCTGNEKRKKIFSVWKLRSRHRNCFAGTVALDCEGKSLCIDRYGDIYVDPHVPKYAQKQIDIGSRFPDCVGRTIVGMDFSYRGITKDRITYGQPIISIGLDNGKTIRFSINNGEVPAEDMAGWFTVDG